MSKIASTFKNHETLIPGIALRPVRALELSRERQGPVGPEDRDSSPRRRVSELQLIHRPRQMIRRRMSVGHSGPDVRTSHQLLDGWLVDAFHHQMTGGGVTEGVQLGEVFDTGRHWTLIYSSFPFSLFVFPLGYAAPFSVFPSCPYLFSPYQPCLFLRV